MSEQEKKENALSSYIGFSGPETPKYLLANNFLSEFFHSISQDRDKQKWYQNFYQDGILNCEEDNDQIKKQLEESFDRFFNHFAGVDMIESNFGEQNFYFPLKPQLLRNSTYLLRHLLYSMIPEIEEEKKYAKIQEMLKEYLYGESDGVSYLLNILCEKKYGEESGRKAGRRGQEFEMLKSSHYRKVCRNFEDDLTLLLTAPAFRKLDFYKRYDYLATLLNSYVIQFIINKNGIRNRGYILCQGSAASHLLSGGAFHGACVKNYAEIRSIFSKELNEFYVKRLKNETAGEEMIALHRQGQEIYVKDQVFTDFVFRVFGSKYKDTATLYEAVRKMFGLEKEGQKYFFRKEDFAMRYIDVSSARKGSVLTKISSTLPTCGKNIEFIFPKNRSRHKYFALSPSLLEFYVRLYLADNTRTYAYLDGFLEHLQERYGLCIQKSEQMDKILQKLYIKLPFAEFRQNEQALIDNLNEINCLIRLSDSGYVITLPEEKGEFKLL